MSLRQALASALSRAAERIRPPKREVDHLVWAEPRQLIAERADLHFDLHDDGNPDFVHMVAFKDGAGAIAGCIIPRAAVQAVGEPIFEHAARAFVQHMEDEDR